jgi:dihydroxyacetone kinase DhaKLM complex PTS-EIIA-like component DhaM
MLKKILKLILTKSYNFRNKYNLTASKNIYILKLRNFFSHKINKILDKQTKDYILIFCPIEFGGLTVQLDQVAKILDEEKINFKITWHSPPKNNRSPYIKKFVDYATLNSCIQPKLIIYFERFPYIRNLVLVPSIFYINIDWLDKKDFINSLNYADLILYPISYRENFFKSLYKNRIFYKLLWPAFFYFKNINLKRISDKKLNVFYVGKFNNSRKNSDVLLSSLKQFKFINLRFLIKIIDNDRVFKTQNEVENLSGFISNDKIKSIYSKSHLALLCNSSEGNGLTIIEAIEAGCVPILIDGEPMNSIVPDNCCFKIKSLSFKRKKFAKDYKINEESLTNTLSKITHKNYLEKYENLLKFRESEIFRERYNFKKNFLSLLNIYIPKISNNTNQVIDKVNLVNSIKHTIELFITTGQRIDFFKKSFETVKDAIKKSKHNINITIIIDGDNRNLNQYIDYLSMTGCQYSLVFHNISLGLPYTMRFIKFYLENKYERNAMSLSGFTCYLQDDCIINNNFNYFDDMVELNYLALPYNDIGITSGFKNEIHPGFEKRRLNKKEITLSNTIDGKNIFTFTKKFLRMGKHKFYDSKLRKLGNPGPNRGSQFDIFIWKEDKYFKNKINVILDNAISIIEESKKRKYSTWSNSEGEEVIQKRLREGRIYK